MNDWIPLLITKRNDQMLDVSEPNKLAFSWKCDREREFHSEQLAQLTDVNYATLFPVFRLRSLTFHSLLLLYSYSFLSCIRITPFVYVLWPKATVTFLEYKVFCFRGIQSRWHLHKVIVLRDLVLCRGLCENKLFTRQRPKDCMTSKKVSEDGKVSSNAQNAWLSLVVVATLLFCVNFDIVRENNRQLA